MTKSIDLINAKIARIAFHNDLLNEEYSKFFKSNPYTIEKRLNKDKGICDYVLTECAEIPLVLGAIAGEVVTGLRSLLDHVAWQISLKHSDCPNKKTEFPVFLEEALYQKKIREKIGAFPSEASDIVRRYQPFNIVNAENHPLWTLHRFANIEKHRIITLASACICNLGVNQNGAPGFDFYVKSHISNVKLGASVAELVFNNGVPDPFDEAEASIGIQLTIDLHLISENNTLLGLKSAIQNYFIMTNSIINDLRPFMA